MARRPSPAEIARQRTLTLAIAKAKAASDSAPLGPVSPITFRQYVDKVRPGYIWYRHCEQLAAVLQRVADGELDRVMVFMPPRHGKSELVSRLFTGYYLYRHPARWVGVNSYGSELAYTLSRSARTFFDRAGGKVRGDAHAVKHWETTDGGGLWAAGVGGPITGKGFHLGVIDDPIKNAQDAASEVIREGQKEWYGSTFYTRAEPGHAIVVVQTRWHEEDLSGWLVEKEKGSDEEKERWHVVSMPAIKEDEPPTFPASCTVEPDPRQPGEALCPERYPLKRLATIARTVGSYIFAALFQQRPSPAGGGMFKTFPIVHAVPRDARRVRYWDKAGTDGGGCYTAGVKLAMCRDGRWIVEHVVRGQWSAGDREKVIRETAEIDGRSCHVWVEKEGGSGGKESAENTVKLLAGFVCKVDSVTGDKVARAQPLAAQTEVENVFILAGDWNQDFVDEARSFPNGKYKDQIDAASGAFNKLNLEPRPSAPSASPAAGLPPVPTAAPGMPGIPNAMGRGY